MLEFEARLGVRRGKRGRRTIRKVVLRFECLRLDGTGCHHGPFIGYLVAGVAGATSAALGIFLPVRLVVLLAPSRKRSGEEPATERVRSRRYRRATGAIAGAVIVLTRRSVCHPPTILICAVSLAVLFRWKVPEPALIACAAVAGRVLPHP